jgi:hypothetical protein
LHPVFDLQTLLYSCNVTIGVQAFSFSYLWWGKVTVDDADFSKAKCNTILPDEYDNYEGGTKGKPAGGF